MGRGGGGAGRAAKGLRPPFASRGLPVVEERRRAGRVGGARCVPTRAPRAATPPELGGAAEVLTGPAGPRFAGADPGPARRAAFSHPYTREEDVKGAEMLAASYLAEMKFSELYFNTDCLFGFPQGYNPEESYSLPDG